MNIAQSLAHSSSIYPDKPAVIFEGRTLTYRELERAAAQTAAALCALDVQRGDRVALFLPNCAEFIVCYFAIQSIGAIAVSISPMLKHAELSYMLNHSGSSVVITTADLYPALPLDQLTSVRHVFSAEGAAAGLQSLEALRAQMQPLSALASVHEHDPAAILYTSGTTGLPKGATLSHGNVRFTARSKQRYCTITPEDRLLLFLPLFHCFGQNAVMVSAIHAGATLVLHRRFSLPAIIDSISQHQVSLFFGVPTTYITLLNSPLTRADVPSLRYYFSAAAVLPEAVAAAWRARFAIPIHEGYGLTETSPFASYNHVDAYRIGSIGTPIADVAMKIVDETGAELAPGARGEIVIKGPNVMLGYWNAPAETARVLRDGWLASGDVGVRDADGYFYLVDRIKDMINISGFKVYPAEVERLLFTHPAVREAAVYGVADPLKGEAVHALIVPESAQPISPEELARYCHERTAPYKVPSHFEFVDALPKSPSGKVLRRLLRQQHSPVEV